MFRFLFVSAAIIPVAILPWWQSATSKTRPMMEKTLVAEVSATSELLECKDADISIYFHDLFVTSHSAQYITEGIRSAGACEDVEFEIVPLISETASDDDIALSLEQSSELQDYISLMGFEASISKKIIQEDYNSDHTGRAAYLRIKTSSS